MAQRTGFFTIVGGVLVKTAAECRRKRRGLKLLVFPCRGHWPGGGRTRKNQLAVVD